MAEEWNHRFWFATPGRHGASAILKIHAKAVVVSSVIPVSEHLLDLSYSRAEIEKPHAWNNLRKSELVYEECKSDK